MQRLADVTQFMHASHIQSGNPSAIDGIPQDHIARGEFHLDRPRSRSVTTASETGAIEVKNRMKHTVDYLHKGFKPNTRGEFIQNTFATLEDVLCNVPKDTGFDMEISTSRSSRATRLTLIISRIPTHP